MRNAIHFCHFFLRAFPTIFNKFISHVITALPACF
nr:MAG TPA: hypothetical protein [Caudoviricetes sp.]